MPSLERLAFRFLSSRYDRRGSGSDSDSGGGRGRGSWVRGS